MTRGATGGVIGLAEIARAWARISASSHVRRTPLISGFEMGFDGSRSVRLKLESLQRTGSFKVRGMLNVFQASEANIVQNGAITMSAGNAGRSFATLCANLNVRGTVVMPDSVPMANVRAIEALGSDVLRVPGPTLLEQTRAIVRERGVTLVHPFDDPVLIAGHASVGIELMEDVPTLGPDDCVVVCCGGGGLVSGVAAALKLTLGAERAPRIVAVEPAASPAMHTSLALGRPASIMSPPGAAARRLAAAPVPERAWAPDWDASVTSAAHGLSPPFAGTHTLAHVDAFVDDVVLVEERAIVDAARTLHGEGLVVEASGAAAVAALATGRVERGAYRDVVECSFLPLHFTRIMLTI